MIQILNHLKFSHRSLRLCSFTFSLCASFWIVSISLSPKYLTISPHLVSNGLLFHPTYFSFQIVYFSSLEVSLLFLPIFFTNFSPNFVHNLLCIIVHIYKTYTINIKNIYKVLVNLYLVMILIFPVSLHPREFFT